MPLAALPILLLWIYGVGDRAAGRGDRRLRAQPGAAGGARRAPGHRFALALPWYASSPGAGAAATWPAWWIWLAGCASIRCRWSRWSNRRTSWTGGRLDDEGDRHVLLIEPETTMLLLLVDRLLLHDQMSTAAFPAPGRAGRDHQVEARSTVGPLHVPSIEHPAGRWRKRRLAVEQGLPRDGRQRRLRPRCRGLVNPARPPRPPGPPSGIAHPPGEPPSRRSPAPNRCRSPGGETRSHAPRSSTRWSSSAANRLGKDHAAAQDRARPRRIAARQRGQAHRRQELNSPLGEVVGYKVRFQDRLQAGASVKLMTDGILLAETQGDPLLRAYDTLIIDEAHERSLNIDFLLGYLRQIAAAGGLT